MPDEPLSRTEFWQRVAVASLALFGVLATVITMGISFARAISVDSQASNQIISQQITSISNSLAEMRLVNERRLTQIEERQSGNIKAKEDHENRISSLERAKNR